MLLGRAIWLIWLMAAANCVQAGTGPILTFPLPRVRPRSGIVLTVDTRWVSGSGYRPVRVRVAPIAGGVAPADRYFTVTVRPHGWYGSTQAVAATGTVQLPQGELYGETSIDIPQMGSWSWFEVETYEDGNRLSDLCSDEALAPNRFYYEMRDDLPTILLVHRMAPQWQFANRVPDYTGVSSAAVVVRAVPVSLGSVPGAVPLLMPDIVGAGQVAPTQELQFLPDIRALAGRFPYNYYNNGVTVDRWSTANPTTDSETMRLVNDLPFLEILPPSILPDRWISYTGVDVVITSLGDLEQLATEYPQKFAALQSWLSTGTLLCVSGAGAQYERLGRVEELLGLVPEKSDAKDSVQGWSKPDPRHRTEDVSSIKDVYRVTPFGATTSVVEGEDSPKPKPKEDPRLEGMPPFVYRDAGRGNVVAIAVENPFPGEVEFWSWIFNTIPSRHWVWAQRHGLSFHSDNEQFWNFLIPDIGRAPVMSFLALISLFAVVIGPVNYWVLQRRGRLYLLLVTVPAGALVITGGLFFYAMAADGFAVRARVRSLTEIDQRHKRAVSWSRQTYYAGLAPSRGLVFPADSAAYAIDFRPTNRMGFEDESRETRWGDEQHLASGYFVSRTISQVMLVEPRETTAGLHVIEPDGEGPPRVVNELGVRIERLLLCDARGGYFRGSSLDAAATGELQAAVKADEAVQWRALYGTHRPRYPEGFDPSDLENVTGIFGIPYRSQLNDAVALDKSIFELGLSTTLSSDFRWMEPRTYVALVPRPPSVSLGVEQAVEVGGFHVIVGRW